MKILIINGSPKGEYSTTLYTSLYIQKHFPEHTFEVIHAAQRSAALQKDLTPLTEKMKNADLILFSYPVYTYLVPSQLHVLIEKMKEEHLDFSGKYMTQITTSKHYYDVTAHKFMEENGRDLGMICIPGLSADMEDLLKEEGQKQALAFFDYVQWYMGKEMEEVQKTFDVVVVTDLQEGDTGLQHKINVFREHCRDRVRVVNLREFPFRGGCLGCLNCASDGKCVYQDGFDTYLREEIQNSDAILYAFTIKDHSMGSRFKMYDDRQFCNGHRAVMAGSPVGYIVNGDLSKEENLHMLLEARSDAGGNFLTGIASQDEEIVRMADTLRYALVKGYSRPQMFYGVGGMKIFRDLIYQMRGFMKADHAFFKEHDLYDYPQKKKGTIASMYLVGALFANENIRKKAGPQIKEGMVSSYKKVLEEK